MTRGFFTASFDRRTLGTRGWLESERVRPANLPPHMRISLSRSEIGICCLLDGLALFLVASLRFWLASRADRGKGRPLAGRAAACPCGGRARCHARRWAGAWFGSLSDGAGFSLPGSFQRDVRVSP